MSLPLAFLYGDFGRVGLVDMDSPLSSHVHRHYHFIFKLAGEDTTFRVGEREHDLSDGTAVLIEPWQPHGWNGPQTAGARTLFLTFYIEPRWLAGMTAGAGGQRPEAGPSVQSLPHVRLAPDLQAGVLALADSLLAVRRDETTALSQVRQICERMVERHLPSGVPAEARGRFQDFRIRRALARLDDPATGGQLDRIAGEVGLSRSHFFELFRRSTGFSPQFYINVTRMESAIEGLTRTEAPLADLADTLGFSTQGNFTRFFRHQLGVTPDRFRNAALEARG